MPHDEKAEGTCEQHAHPAPRAANRIPIQIRRRQKRQVRGLILDSIRMIQLSVGKTLIRGVNLNN